MIRRYLLALVLLTSSSAIACPKSQKKVRVEIANDLILIGCEDKSKLLQGITFLRNARTKKLFGVGWFKNNKPNGRWTIFDDKETVSPLYKDGVLVEGPGQAFLTEFEEQGPESH